MINGVLIAIGVAAIFTMQQVFASWLMRLQTLAIAGGAALLAFGVFKSLVKPELEASVRAALVSRRSRIAICTFLVLEVVAAVVLMARPPSHIVRLVPGPELNQQLGFDHQRLDVELDGRRYSIDAPQPRVFYAGASTVMVQERVDREDVKVREAVLNSVLEGPPYLLRNEDGVRGVREMWLTGPPKVMKSEPGAVPRKLRAFFTEGKRKTELSVERRKSDDAIETYVIEKP